MKRTLAVILVCGSINAFAQIGDGYENVSNGKENIITLYTHSKTVLSDLFGDPTRTNQFKNFTISNSDYKPLKINFSNANVASFDVMSTKNNKPSIGYEVSTIFDDQSRTAPIKEHFIPRNGWIAGLDITQQDIERNSLSKGLKSIQAEYPNAKYLTTVRVEKSMDNTGANIDYSYIFSPTAKPKETDQNCSSYIYYPDSGRIIPSYEANNFNCFKRI